MILFRQEFRPIHLVDLLRRELEPIRPGLTGEHPANGIVLSEGTCLAGLLG